MNPEQTDLIKFSLEAGVLKFGEFTLKSGRQSPYFFNLGHFDNGPRLARLGDFFAAYIARAKLDGEILYGPAYKGIPLATAIAISLANRHSRHLGVSFNRKEAKDHGEGGILIGHPVSGRKVIVVDDVISAGTSIRESIETLRNAGAIVSSVLVALDRAELGKGEKWSAARELSDEFDVQIHSLVGLDDLFSFVSENAEFTSYREAIDQYRSRYAGDPGTIS